MYELVFEAAKRILDGAVLHASDVTAGNGKVYDWRTVKCGELVDDGGDAFDQAMLFVALAGPDACRALFERQDVTGEEETLFGVHWSDPNNRREPEGWILRDGVRRWTGTKAEAERKARVYQGSAWEGSTTTYEARACAGEDD